MKKTNKNKTIINRISISEIFTVAVTAIVVCASSIALFTFVTVYKNATEKNVVTSIEQAVGQVKNMVTNYTEEMEMLMQMLDTKMAEGEQEAGEFFGNLMEVGNDIVAITTYDDEGTLLDCWSNGQKLKENCIRNLSYTPELIENGELLNISKPHVETLFVDYYPWVVTISQYMENAKGESIQVAMDIQFSNIAQYIDNVGIGQHGYCYIMDSKGDIIYHPQQQLVYAGLKEEKDSGELREGTHINSEAIYSVVSLENCDWHIVGVCYVDEMITKRVEEAVNTLLAIMLVVIISSFIAGSIFSKIFSKPAKQLAEEMQEFEKDTDNFVFREVNGMKEITAISDSFEHMVLRIQKLVEQVREEEITLRKTELKALQAQINPHFLYNTLDAIAWCCEEERHKDAVEMVNALAKLFRISISKGHELITIEKELQHAQSYLKIQKFRYKNQFVYSFDVYEECLPYLCNKITLQPIIENAIYHGLDRMVDEGEIRIRIYPDGDDIVFTVSDNGVGMTPEQCQEILQDESGEKTGIGIKNVNDRIKIYFGENYGLTIESELDEGTTVTIRMPKVMENNYEEK